MPTVQYMTDIAGMGGLHLSTFLEVQDVERQDVARSDAGKTVHIFGIEVALQQHEHTASGYKLYARSHRATS